MKNILTIFWVCASLNGVLGQNERQAEQLFERLGFQSAIEAYKNSTKANKGPKGDFSRALQMAESYRLNGKYASAVPYYATVVQLSDEPKYMLRYAQCLHTIGQFKLAKSYYLQYDERVGHLDPTGKLMAESIDKAGNFAAHGDVKLYNLDINSPALDFSPTLLGDKLYFASNRSNFSKASTYTDAWTNAGFTDIWVCDINDNQALSAPTPLQGPINSKFHEGPASVSPGGQQVYFTRNLYTAGKRNYDKKKITRLGIFSADLIDDWGTNIRPFKQNDKSHSVCHPALSRDGQKLFYAADIPGGFGGYDLYYSVLQDGDWSEPINLGPNINTALDEHFPVLGADGILYFASKGLPGLGGYDMFAAKTKPSTTPNNLVFQEAVNLGMPFNSSWDDFGIVFAYTQQSGYFSSNRPGGKGEDDIYYVEFAEPLDKLAKARFYKGTICINDHATKEPIPYADLVVEKIQARTGRLLDMISLTTNEKGKVNLELEADYRYAISVTAKDYESSYDDLIASDLYLSQGFEHCIPIRSIYPENCIILRGLVVNASYSDYRVPNAKIKIVDKCLGEEIKIQGNEDGTFNYCLKCNCEYLVMAEKADFKKDQAILSINKSSCNAKELRLKLSLSTVRLSQVEPLASTTKSTNGDIAEGLVIELNKVYYDYDQSYIRDDVKPELNNLASLMKAYPSMSIELSSHTDCRASESYNLKLSQRRADAAKTYLISKGIAPSRIDAVGYGESRPRVTCSDCEKCSETEHQLNRRTEARVTKFDQKDIQVKYKED